MKVDMPALPADYRSARAAFLAAARDAGAEVWEHMHPLPGPDLGPLAISTAHINPDAPRQLMVVSGTHGVEGFAGSACQTAMLRSPMARNVPNSVGMFLVHALNPYGFAHVRRVNEDNVDLNRNFIDFTAARPSNPEYDKIADLLVPAEWDAETREATTNALLEWMAEVGADDAQAVVTRGQYEHETGLFYGGRAPSWSRSTFETFTRSRLGRAGKVSIIDLHTGLGPRGHGEIISAAEPGTEAYERAQRWYDGQVRSSAGGESVSAPLQGEWLDAAPSWLPNAETTGIAIEWGTVDGLEVLDALRGDAWLHGHASPDHDLAPEIKARLRDAFAPDDPDWAAAVHRRFTEVAPMALAGLLS